MTDAPAVAALVMARAPRPGQAKTRLEPLLGPDGCARLQAVLIARAARWASEVAPGAAFLAVDPPDGMGEVEALVPPGVTVIAQAGRDLGARMAAAAAHVHAATPVPTLIVGTDLPALAPAHAAAALADLAEGSDLAIGPALDGGYYLLALPAPRAGLFALPPDAWGTEQVMALTLGAAGAADLEVGLLRAERDLDTPDDAAAALADPLTPAEIRAALTPGPPV